MSKKSILFRWFGIGKIPSTVRKALESEGIVLMDEGITGKVYFRNYKAPGKRFTRKTSLFTGSVVITRRRFAAFAFSRKIADFPMKKSSVQKVKFRESKPGVLTMGFNAEDFDQNSSGRVEFSFKTPLTGEMLKKIKEI